MRTVVYFGSREIYQDLNTAVNSLLAHTKVDKIYAVIEDDKLPFDLPVECVKWKAKEFNRINKGTRWRQFGCVRSVMTKLFPNLDTILSLDLDTIVEQDISELFDIDLDGYYYAAAREPALSTEKVYFNSGVSLLNLKMLRETGKDNEMIRALNSFEFEYVAQDCFNKYCDKVYELSSDYNACRFTLPTDNVKIRHYAADWEWRDLPEVIKYR